MDQMTARIHKLAFIIIPLMAAGAGIIWWPAWRLPFSIATGGLLSLASLRIIIWAVKRFLNVHMGQTIIMGISTLKILALFSVMVALAVMGLLHVVGMVIGFTTVLVITTIEGYRAARADTL
ncbi:MAG TPA: hypothetical protein VK445_11610 [Dissulfurispiraceae bacterium]|nr:hypothetical protein [Dissulfurispiraceae bacterium]